jgi:hypothetical protein
MAQHDYDIANQSFPSFRSDLNSVLEAINTSNSGTSRPSSAVAGTIWLDTTSASTPTLKFYDGSDDISLATLDYTANTVNWLDSTVTISSLSQDLDVNGNSIISSANGNITFTPDGTGKVIIDGLSFPTADGSSGQAIVTDGCGNLSFASVEGRTGTVDWQTTPKTANFTATNGEGYFVNTTSGAVTMTMPSGSAGAIVSIQDYNKTFDTNNLTITPASGEKINGGTADGDLKISTEGQGLTFIYVDSTVGWKTVHENEFTSGGSSFMVATGGTVTTCGNCKIHTFTGPGTFCVSCVALCSANNVVSYTVVAGGGGGGECRAGGGGAGGFREVKSPVTPYTASPLDGYPSAPNRVTVTATSFPITVGAGGAGSTTNQAAASPGANSTFSTITSTGGGGGASDATAPNAHDGLPGGSGGGAANAGSPGSGNTPPVTPPQGNNGGSSDGGWTGSGGGGAAGSGSPAGPCCSPGPGGAGVATLINTATGETGPGPSQYYAGGGGGGGAQSGGPGAPAGTGGIGGGGDGSATGCGTAPAGTANTGGGGGGNGGPTGCGVGGAGGSGIVIIRYKYQ